MSSFRMAWARPARGSADGLVQAQKHSCDLPGAEATSHGVGGPDGKFHVGNCLSAASFVLYKVLGGLLSLYF